MNRRTVLLILPHENDFRAKSIIEVHFNMISESSAPEVDERLRVSTYLRVGAHTNLTHNAQSRLDKPHCGTTNLFDACSVCEFLPCAICTSQCLS